MRCVELSAVPTPSWLVHEQVIHDAQLSSWLDEIDGADLRDRWLGEVAARSPSRGRAGRCCPTWATAGWGRWRPSGAPSWARLADKTLPVVLAFGSRLDSPRLEKVRPGHRPRHQGWRA